MGRAEPYWTLRYWLLDIGRRSAYGIWAIGDGLLAMGRLRLWDMGYWRLAIGYWTAFRLMDNGRFAIGYWI